jgi:mono/diheme cytochrome c family protein
VPNQSAQSRWMCLLVLALAAGFTAACAPAEGLWPEGVTPELAEEGRGIFLKQGFCFTCHDYDGNGGAGANLADDEWWHSDGSYEGIVATIIRGVPADEAIGGPASMMLPKGGTSMSEEQVRAVAAFIWSLRLPDSTAVSESEG